MYRLLKYLIVFLAECNDTSFDLRIFTAACHTYILLIVFNNINVLYVGVHQHGHFVSPVLPLFQTTVIRIRARTAETARTELIPTPVTVRKVFLVLTVTET